MTKKKLTDEQSVEVIELIEKDDSKGLKIYYEENDLHFDAVGNIYDIYCFLSKSGDELIAARGEDNFAKKILKNFDPNLGYKNQEAALFHASYKG